MSNPKITVVIPTRERGDVLGAALRTVVSQDYDNLEILVSDNCSTDQTADVVRGFADPRIRYVNTGKRVSMSHNFEFALSHVTDGFVMVIGDDDGIVPGALDRVARIIQDTGAKALASRVCTFIWPNAENEGMGRLLVPMRQGHETRSTKKWLQRVVTGRDWYSRLPMLYTGGVVHASLIDNVRRRTGIFFHSCMPDIYSTIALAEIVDQYVFSHDPFSIAALSRHSNGASWQAASKGSASAEALAPMRKFIGEEIIAWHQDVPVFDDNTIPLSCDILVYESYLQALGLNRNAVGLTHQGQLSLFISRGAADRERLERWIGLFVIRHGLDLNKAKRAAPFLRARIAWDKFFEYLYAFIDVYRLDPPFGVKMRDVYEASIVASALLSTRPSRVRSYNNTLKKWAPRILQPDSALLSGRRNGKATRSLGGVG